LTAVTPEIVHSAVAQAGLGGIDQPEMDQLAAYTDLLMRWNERMNLTAIRDVAGILQRHIVECVAAAQVLPPGIATLLDYGSGAGLPGIPIAIIRKAVRVTLAESQSKKAAFLREAGRSLGLGVEVFGGRVEGLSAGRVFDAVTLRAVDKMGESLREARGRVRHGGFLVAFATAGTREGLMEQMEAAHLMEIALPTAGTLLIARME